VRRRLDWSLLALVVPVCVPAAVTARVASAGSSAAHAGTSITVYSGQHEQAVAALVADFQKRSGVRVSVRSADEGTLANQIIQEGSSSPADVFFAENPPALQALSQRNLLARVPAKTLAAVPKAYSSARGDWVGVSARAAALVFNTKEIAASALPASLIDLARPEWKGKLAIAPGETDFQPLITAISVLRGKPAAKAWLEGIKRNAKVLDDNELIVAAVNNGTVATGLVDHYYWYRLRDEVGRSSTHSALHYFAPRDPGMLVDVSGASILRSTKKLAAAQAFLAYLVSAPAQRIIATSESYEYPLGSGVHSTKIIRPLSSLAPARVTSSQLGDGAYALELLRQVGLL
jgi:iron(III) transport system substrate-binding protein